MQLICRSAIKAQRNINVEWRGRDRISSQELQLTIGYTSLHHNHLNYGPGSVRLFIASPTG